MITLAASQCEVFLGLSALTSRVGGVNVMAKQVERLMEVL
ncbi:DUF5753 domain-containing protein [Amycolatopsis thermalba]|uniref:DUF5753 domain-containing protein n=1 Tax=Amycolatopsis thermalba TaxID=944492 RepID=A0ABY4NZA8_9PSEU|nr:MULTISPECIES: DUF5753 domain-containing protein [Amycolatopsis]UQS25429.1 DUF5753 domain-containing protein [Amycolatopsis thermalba]